MSSVAPAASETLDSLVSRFLSVLTNERGASVHTLRAYERELRGLTTWITEHNSKNQDPEGIEHTQIRAYLGTLYDRGLAKSSAVCPPLSR